ISYGFRKRAYGQLGGCGVCSCQAIDRIPLLDRLSRKTPVPNRGFLFFGSESICLGGCAGSACSARIRSSSGTRSFTPATSARRPPLRFCVSYERNDPKGLQAFFRPAACPHPARLFFYSVNDQTVSASPVCRWTPGFIAARQ